MLRHSAALAFASWAFAPAAAGATFGVSTVGGLMTQPTSHYYHAVYGVNLDAATDKESIAGRLSYVERPAFRAQGFEDKDYGAFALVGTKVTKRPGHGLHAYFGVGQMAGYIRSLDDGRGRSYAMKGPTAAVEYAARLGSWTVAAGHQTFAGYVDEVQLEAFVAWPFNFFNVSVGRRW